MWLILQHDTSQEFVIVTSEMHIIRKLVTLAFYKVVLKFAGKVKGNGKSFDLKTGNVLVEVNPKYFRLCEVGQLLNDSTKHRLLLGWNSTKASFHELVRIMVEHDMSFVKKIE